MIIIYDDNEIPHTKRGNRFIGEHWEREGREMCDKKVFTHCKW